MRNWSHADKDIGIRKLNTRAKYWTQTFVNCSVNRFTNVNALTQKRHFIQGVTL